MSCQVVNRPKPLSDDRRGFTMQHLKRGEELGIIVECASLHDIPLVERKKAAKEPLYLARYE